MCPKIERIPNGTVGTHFVPPEGDPATAKYVIIGEAPGQTEYAQRRPFVGRAGKLLNAFMDMVGINREECYLTNLSKWRPRNNTMTADIAMEVQDSLLMELVADVPIDTPILVTGKWSREALVPHTTGKPVLTGRRWYESVTGHRVLATVHPAYVVRNLEQSRLLYFDLQKLKRGPIAVPSPHYHVIRSHTVLNDFIQHLMQPRYDGTYVSFDLETDQIDYQRDRVLCIGITYDEESAVIIPDGYIYNSDAFDQSTYTPGDEITPDMVDKDARYFLDQLFALDHIKWVAHNGKFDLRFMRAQLGVGSARVDFDTMLAHYVLWEEKGTHGLKQLSADYLDFDPDYEDEATQWIPGGRSGKYSNIPRKVLYPYCALDTEATRSLAYIFEKDMKQQGLYEKPFMFPVMSYVEMLLESELAGFPVDVPHVKWVDEFDIQPALDKALQDINEVAYAVSIPKYNPEMSKELNILNKGKVRDLSKRDQERRLYLKTLARAMLGEVNPNSSQVMAGLIYDVIGIPTVEARTISRGKKLKPRSTAKEAQDKMIDEFRTAIQKVLIKKHEDMLRDTLDMGDANLDRWSRMRTADGKEHLDLLLKAYWDHLDGVWLPNWCKPVNLQFIRNLKVYRRILKMRNGYVKPFLRLLGTDGRVHTRYAIHGTVTGRLSASGPALQTIPRDDEHWGKAISDMFVAPEGCQLVYADFSQCELRIAAHLSQDPFMIESFNKDDSDFHSEVAKTIYGPNFTKEQRNWYCKRAVFGWLYGGNVYEIARDALRFPDDMARKFADDWESTFAVAAEWREEQGRLAVKTGVITSPFNRKRRFLAINNRNKIDVIHAGQNNPIQSGAADVTLISALRMTEMYKDIPDVVLGVSVHDSIIFFAPNDLVPCVAKDLQRVMVSTAGEYFPSVPHKADVKFGKRWGSLKDYDEARYKPVQ